MIRVLIIDDHQMFAETLVRLLGEDSRIEVVGAAGTGGEGLELAKQTKPDIVVMDFGLPDMNGAETTQILKAMCPSAKVITLTGSDHRGAYFQMMEAGAAAWVRKTTAVQALRKTIHKVYQGEKVLSEELEDLPTLDQLVVYYQPVVRMKTAEVVGFEGLVRWEQPGGGLLLPGEFMGRAEETGFVNELGRKVREMACTQLLTFQEQGQMGPKLWLSLNVSESGIKRPQLLGEVESAIGAGGIAPEDLVIEVTENVLIEDAEGALKMLRELKKLGVQLSLDDFGTGYSSLSYLQQFPFDHLKLDQSFTRGIPQSTRTMRLVEAIQKVAAALDMDGIAEGVERAEQAMALGDMGWEYGQGFLYSPAVTGEAAVQLILEGQKVGSRE